MIENNCGNCRHLFPIISSISSYWCNVKDEYKDSSDFISNCDSFKQEILHLSDKEDKVW